MKNRFFWQKLHFFLFFWLMASLFWSLSAQNFNFNYGGPDTLFVGEDCTVALNWGHPDSVMITSNTGSGVDTFFIESISTGDTINQLVTANQSISIIYTVRDSAGLEETLTNDSILIAVVDTFNNNLQGLIRDTIGYLKIPLPGKPKATLLLEKIGTFP